ncbi:MAG TPA: outer membrane beta-barrel protein [Xanthobacteraceae bacterium]|nr:outer membrane beta-barrel protein [Xanthobacteraceae bacterium]
MMSFRTVAATLAIIGLSSGVMAHAADMPDLNMPPPPPIDGEFDAGPSSGWYLRGDIGYRSNTVHRASSAASFLDPSDNRMNGGAFFGAGVGFKAGWIRADLTIDYASPVSYTGTIFTPGDVSAKVGATTGLFNLYFDLGTWFGVTPYLGAGAGTAYVRTSDYASLAAPPFGTPAASTQWNLAWAVMAGLSYDISRNLALDVGYRYLNMGDAHTVSDPFGAMTFKSLAAHEVRFGLRWMFDDPLPIL